MSEGHFLRLEGETGEEYLSTARALLAAGRLNNFFPTPAQVDSLFHHLSPLRWKSFHSSFEVSHKNGMPSSHDTTRVLSDARLSEAVLGESSRETLVAELEQTRSAAAERRLLRHDYHRSLIEMPPPQSFSMQLALRKVDPTTQTAYFTVTLDRFDIAENSFVRYTILLSQIGNRWKRQQVDLSGDDLLYTENFRNVISRFASDEAEFAFVLLSDLTSIEVEQVMRCRIGPMYFRGIAMPDDFQALFEQHPEAVVLHFPLDHAGRSDTLPKTASGDPLSPLYRDVLQGGAREAFEQKVEALDYKVWKERRFACTVDAQNSLQALLQQRGAPSVIRTPRRQARPVGTPNTQG